VHIGVDVTLDDQWNPALREVISVNRAIVSLVLRRCHRTD